MKLKLFVWSRTFTRLLPHLEGGIEELKTTSFGCNLLTFLNEVSQLSDPDVPQNNYYNDYQYFPGDIVLATTHNTADFMTQISEIHKKLIQLSSSWAKWNLPCHGVSKIYCLQIAQQNQIQEGWSL